MDLLAINPGLIFWTAVTFVILLLLLKRFVWGPILDAVDRREQSLKIMSDNAEQSRKEAQELLERYERKLAQARKDVNKIIEEGKSKAGKSTDEIIAKARTEAGDLLERAKVEISRERDTAAAEIREHVVKISLKAAERLIQKTLQERDHRQFIEQAISEIDAKAQ